MVSDIFLDNMLKIKFIILGLVKTLHSCKTAEFHKKILAWFNTAFCFFLQILTFLHFLNQEIKNIRFLNNQSMNCFRFFFQSALIFTHIVYLVKRIHMNQIRSIQWDYRKCFIIPRTNQCALRAIKNGALIFNDFTRFGSKHSPKLLCNYK